MKKRKEERDITWIVSCAALVMLLGSLVLLGLTAHEYKVRKIFKASTYLMNEIGR